jgi:hypothetical protein
MSSSEKDLKHLETASTFRSGVALERENSVGSQVTALPENNGTQHFFFMILTETETNHFSSLSPHRVVFHCSLCL